MTIGRLLRLSSRGFLAWCLLSVVGFVFVRPIVSAQLPLIETVVDATQSDYVAHLVVAESTGGPQIAMSCTANREFRLSPGHVVPFLETFDCAKTDARSSLVPTIIFLVLVIGWPLRTPGERHRRVIGAVLLLPGLIALTTPILLLGLVDTVLYPMTFSAASQLQALMQPFVFMELGGRWLLPLAAAALCIRVGAVPRAA